MAKLSKLQQTALDMLPGIVTTTLNGGYVFATTFDVSYLIENGLVEQNEEIFADTDGATAFATRATDLGINSVTKFAASQLEETAPAEIQAIQPTTKGSNKMSFEIESDIELPKTSRGGKRESAYPFDSLEVGQSFFIPASEKHPEPEKTLASTVSGATKRYDVPDLDDNGVQKTKSTRNPKTCEIKENVPVMKHTRVFVIRASEKDGVKGARVFRKA